MWICRISCDSFSFNTRYDYVIPSDFAYKTISDSHAWYQEQVKSLKETCRMKDIMILKHLETIEN